MDKDGKVNYRRYANTLDYSLDQIKLREVYEKVYRRTNFSFYGRKKEYTSRVINVTFKYSVAEFNKAGRNRYIRFGYKDSDLKLIRSNPCELVRLPKLERREYEWYNASEINTLLETIKDEPLHPLIQTTVMYGLRRSEVLGLQWQSIDFDTNTILIRHTVSMSTKVVEKDKTKNKSSYRSFPLFPEIRELLLQLKEEEQKNREFFGDTYVENDYIFKWANGAMYDPSYISHKFGDLLRKYNLPHIRFHDLRHSCASLLLAKGCSLKDVQDWMGHADIKMTCNIYGHLDLSRKKMTSEIIRETLAQAC